MLFLGPGNQPSTVDSSGTVVNQNVTFPAGSGASQIRSFNINNDDTALETNEMYNLNLAAHYFTGSNQVVLGGGAGIIIQDDDGNPNLCPSHACLYLCSYDKVLGPFCESICKDCIFSIL